MRLSCDLCGIAVSNKVPEKTTVRAVIICHECIAATVERLPQYCGYCGAHLAGGATEHKPGCEIPKLIEDCFQKYEE